ncbi:MAG: HAD family hydrolase [Chlamydiota bacterium]
MDYIDKYQLFLLDFDGLLVNTEELHYKAYQQLLANHDYKLPWSFAQYCHIAHYHSDLIRDKIYAEYPALEEEYPRWSTLYTEKKQIYSGLVDEGAITLMPGVAEFLGVLKEKNVQHCVVTHSPKEHIEKIRHQIPLLNTIPHWFTREDYGRPKPAPDCCLSAMDFFGVDPQDTVGLDDTPRGIQALLNADVQPIWVTAIDYPDAQDYLRQGVLYYHSLPDLMELQS